MIHSHFKIAEGFDVKPLVIELSRQPWLFGQHPERLAGASPHRETTDIWVRYNRNLPIFGGAPWVNANDEHDSAWYDAYYVLPQVRTLVFRLMSLVNGERLGAVFITKTPPGGRIYPHTDTGWHAGYYDKYYVALQNGTDCPFAFPDGVVQPDEGEVWWFDNSVTHSVTNNNDTDRLSMIVCIRSDSTKNAVRSVA